MKKKAEKNYLDEEWDRMILHLEGFIETGDQEQLHRFRVQVKKLRAMLLLLDFPSGRQKLSKDFKPIKKIFRHGGLIREAYLNLLLGGRYQLNNEEFVLTMVNEMEANILAFKNNARKYLKIVKAVYTRLEGDLKPVANDRINEFYKIQLEQIALNLSELQFNEELHNCRKRIKILMYNRKIAQNALEGKLQVNTDYLDELQNSIGDWHDNELAIILFSSLGVGAKPAITKIKRQNTKLKKSIQILTRDFWKKATIAEPGETSPIRMV